MKQLSKRKYFWIKRERETTMYSTKKNQFGLVSRENVKSKRCLI